MCVCLDGWMDKFVGRYIDEWLSIYIKMQAILF